MLAFDNLNPDSAEICFAVAFFLAIIAAVAYAVRRADVVVWAPVILCLSVAAGWLSFWIA